MPIRMLAQEVEEYVAVRWVALSLLPVSEIVGYIFGDNIWANAWVWGFLAGVCRWIYAKQDWHEGLGSILVGTITAGAFNNAQLSVISKMFETMTPEVSHTVNSFVMGFGGMVILGILFDLAKTIKIGGTASP